MSARQRDRSLANLDRALARLEKALRVPRDAPLAVDGTIQRFEFAIELTWKSLKRVLADEGVETATPREAVAQAYRARWIDDETLWLSMLRDRNATSHIYDEETAERIYARIGTYAPVLRAAWQTLMGRENPVRHTE